MRIAFDVKGTIEGSRGTIILEALRKLQHLGHTCVVWSNLYSYSVDAVKKHGLDVEPMSKQMMLDYDTPDQAFDVAIDDDRSQTWLGAKHIIWVDEIKGNGDDLVEMILKGGQNETSKV